MKNIIFKIWIAIIFMFMGISCHKSTVKNCQPVSINGSQTDIKGDWKQVQGKTVFFNPKTIDYSCDNIIYHFRMNDSLIIESDVISPIGYESGNYGYQFTLGSLYNDPAKKYTLKIGNSNWACGISGGDLVLDSSPLDGPILYLVRIK
jgi:hypothetical protein